MSFESRFLTQREITSSNEGPDGTRTKTFLGDEIELINLFISIKY